MEEVERILKESRTIAIAGASPNPERPSNIVMRYLKEKGYHVIPVNPAEKEILGERCYPSVASIPGPVDVVDVFRRPSDLPPIVGEAISKGAKVVWMQEGIVNEEAAAKAREAGLKVVMDRCMKKEHLRLSLEGRLGA